MNPLLQTGIGWRQPHYRALVERRPALGFIEVHSENFFGDGGAALAVLERGRALYPVSLHGVGLGLGSAVGIDAGHLAQLARLVERIEPVRVSDHASFARVATPSGVVHAGDLLPLAFDQPTLDVLCGNVQRVQERLRREILIENLSAYVQPVPAGEVFDEPAFFNALTRRTGCRVLLDLNNLVVNALNAGHDETGAVTHACAWVDSIDPGSVAELHLAGHCRVGDQVIDDHGSRVSDMVWAVLRHTVHRLGPRPTLIEWDTDVPALDVLLDEAGKAAHCIARPVPPRPDESLVARQGRLLCDLAEGATAGQRAYRDNARAIAERALAAAYPALSKRLGGDAFRGLAQALWRADPPTEGDLAVWGGGLAAFLAGPQGLPDEPMLAELARLEWSLHRAAYDADHDAPPQGLERLGTDDPAQLRLRWTPGTGGQASRFPIVSWREGRDAQGAEHAWWWRRGWRVELTALGPGEACFHTAIDAGLPLGEALDHVLARHPDFDFARWLQGALEGGWLAALEPMSSQETTP